MKATITRIGNSRGLIIPVQLLKECGFEDEVSLHVKDDSLIVSKAGKPRSDWEDAFIKAGADQNIIGDLANEFDESEWKW